MSGTRSVGSAKPLTVMSVSIPKRSRTLRSTVGSAAISVPPSAIASPSTPCGVCVAIAAPMQAAAPRGRGRLTSAAAPPDAPPGPHRSEESAMTVALRALRSPSPS